MWQNEIFPFCPKFADLSKTACATPMVYTDDE